MDSLKELESTSRSDDLGLLTPLLSSIKNAIALNNEMILSNMPEKILNHEGRTVTPSVILTIVKGM